MAIETFLASVGAKLAADVLKASAGRVRRLFAKDERQKALEAALVEALAAALDSCGLDRLHRDHYESFLGQVFAAEPMVEELAQLLDPRPGWAPHVPALVAAFEAEGGAPELLTDFELEPFLREFLGAFYKAVAQRAAFQGVVEIKLLGQAVGSLGLLVEHGERQTAAVETTAAEVKALRQEIRALVAGTGGERALLAAGEAVTQAGYRVTYEALEDVRAALPDAAGLDVDVTVQGEVELRRRPAVERPLGPEAERALLQLVRELRSAVEEHPPDAAELATLEQRYRQHLMRWFESLEFRGMMRAPKPIRLPLEEVYVELRSVAEVPEAADSWSAEERRLLLAAEGREEDGRRELLRELDTLRRERWSRQIPERRPLAEALLARDRRAFVILGDPGSGKTTLLHFLALVFARGPEAAAARLGIDALEADRLPIFAPLAAFDDMRRERPELNLAEFLPLYYDRRRGLAGLGPLFRRALESGRALVLLDGLDEVLQESSRAYVAAQAGAMISEGTGRGVRFAISSRFVGYREAPVSGNIATLSVLDFGLPEIRLFAGRWARVFERFMADGDTPEALEKARQLEAGLLADVESNDSVRRLAANPLMLTMLALLRRQVGRLPQRRVQLFESYVGTLLEHWVEMRTFGERVEERKKLDRLTAESLLMPLALWLQRTRPSGTAGRTEMAAELTRVCLAQAGRSEDKATPAERRAAEIEADRFLQEMRETIGLLIERGHDAFGFLHLTFQEYFAGRALARLKDNERWQELEPHLHDPRWREPLLLCAGWLGVVEGRREQVSDLVRRILTVKDPRERYLHRHLLLALAVAGDDVNLEPELVDELARRAVKVYQKSEIPVLVRELLEALVRLIENGAVGFEEAFRPALRSTWDDQAIAYEILPQLGAREDVVGALLEALSRDTRRAAATQKKIYTAAAALARENQALHARLIALAREESQSVWAGEALASLSRDDVAARGVLLEALHEGQSAYRGWILSLLAPAVKAPEVRRLMLLGLEDSDFSVATGAARALGTLVTTDQEVREALLRHIHLGPSQLRATVAATLESLYTVDSNVQLAVTSLLEEASADEVGELVPAVGRLARGNEALRTFLWANLEHPLEWVRLPAMEALAGLPWEGRLSDFASRQAAGPFWATREELAKILGGGEIPVECRGLLEIIQANTRDEDAAWIIPPSLELLTPFVPPTQLAEGFIKPCLEHGTPHIRAAMIQALASRFHDEEVARVVLEKCEDEAGEVRAAAIDVLSSRVSDEPICRVVLSKLEDEWFSVRVAAVGALSTRVGKKSIDQAVLTRLEDEDDTVRAAAVDALASRVEDELIGQTVLEKLEDKRYSVREAAIEALSSRVREESIGQAVLAKLEDEDNEVRAAAIDALTLRVGEELIGQAVLAKLEDEDSYVRAAAIDALALRVGEELIGQAVLAKLEDEDNYVRAAAIDALASRVCEKSIGGMIVKKLQDEDPAVRAAAIDAFKARLGEKSIEKLVLERLEDSAWEPRAAAFEALWSLANSNQTLQARLESMDLFPSRPGTLVALRALASEGMLASGFWRRLSGWLGQECLYYGGSHSFSALQQQREFAAIIGMRLPRDPLLVEQVRTMLGMTRASSRLGAALTLLAWPGGPREGDRDAVVAALLDDRDLTSYPARLQATGFLINQNRMTEASIDLCLEALDYGNQPWDEITDSSQIRRQAALTLAKLDPIHFHPRAYNKLLQVMKVDTDPDVRDAAYQALVRLARVADQQKSQKLAKRHLPRR